MTTTNEIDIAATVMAEFQTEAQSRIAARIEANRADDERRRQEREAHERAVADLTTRRDDLRGEIEALQAQRVALGEAGTSDLAYRGALAGLILAHVCGCQPRQGFTFPIHDPERAKQYLRAAGWKESSPGHWSRGPGVGNTLQSAVKFQILDDLNAASRLLETQRQEASARMGMTLRELHIEPLR